MNFRIVLLLTIGVIFSTACKKQSDNVFLSNEGTKGFDGYSFTDTFQLLTSTVREDSLKTDSISHNLIGVINDGPFGQYQASTFFQFNLPQLGKVISTEKLDSVVLFIQFTSKISYYGDLNSVTSFKVYELDETMNSSVSHSNQTYNYKAGNVGSYLGKFKVNDSLSITELGKKVKVAPGISIKLSSTLATKLFNATASDLSSQENFQSFFKGLALIPDVNPASGEGVIAGINLLGTFTKLRIYYNDSLQSDFTLFESSRRFSHYQISGQSSIITQQKNSVNGNFDTTYILSMTGAKTKVRIPNLFGIINTNGKKISIGKAELIIRPVAGTFADPFTLPTRLLVLQPNPENKLNAGIIDLLEPFYGGEYNSVSNEYRFNITRHIQSLFTEYQNSGINNNRGLYILTPSDYPIAPSRIYLDTRKGMSGTGIEFKLIYTEL